MGMPWLRHLPFFSATFAEFDAQVSETYKFFEDNIHERIEQHRTQNQKHVADDDEKEPKDLLDAFLNQMQKDSAAGDGETEFK